MRHGAGRVPRSPAEYSGNSLEHKGSTVDAEQPQELLHTNAAQLPHELFQPHC